MSKQLNKNISGIIILYSFKMLTSTLKRPVVGASGCFSALTAQRFREFWNSIFYS